ncbi:leucyl/phenylalanyl-tRNA--protein transferase [Oceanisphaera pacifica]|uniref:Leucyl/phenylalanyl-tRNA--protein transferase n=1 Tax=Oceanisphaera pacifica TaxID=2818389 RepID=A0ABS3NJ50_9GAMM|nr:leucyl/phenylalanyl-tRNA--protein transferase [Oceanisphaera pacifica]MBO1520618.1 leucyl/phenylalanyl-tRNA--protein transferase [Oceanisphaera pacifica]
MLTLLDHTLRFPPPAKALQDPEGLLAVGGDLSPQRLLLAYQMGIFPWFEQDQPILWWSPNPRAVIEPDKLHVSRSLAKLARQNRYQVTINTAFEQVIHACRSLREYKEGTWITQEIEQAYCQLHQQGHAHSVEVWQEERLVAGLYGINLGSIFCGESMFHQVDNGSKLAMLALCQHFKRVGGQLIDCQLPNPHLMSLGVTTWPRTRFLYTLKQCQQEQLTPKCWQPGELILCEK